MDEIDDLRSYMEAWRECELGGLNEGELCCNSVAGSLRGRGEAMGDCGTKPDGTIE